jgi:porphobilinogen synthase
MVLIADLCLDEYTDHGHCGLLDDRGEVDNDPPSPSTPSVARAQARAGADIVAPSGMMDGQVAAIRAASTATAAPGAILAYAAKYASALYGPFRDAVDVTIAGGGNRRATSRTPATGREALRRGGARRRRGGGHGDGQAGPGLPRRHRRRASRGRRCRWPPTT